MTTKTTRKGKCPDCGTKMVQEVDGDRLVLAFCPNFLNHPSKTEAGGE